MKLIVAEVDLSENEISRVKKLLPACEASEKTPMPKALSVIRKITSEFLLFLISITICTKELYAQPSQFQPEKAGKFILQNTLSKCPGMDITSLTSRLSEITNWVRQNNSVISSPTGNDVLANLSGNLCGRPSIGENFGIQSHIYFSFHHFYIDNGVSKTATGNTAHGTQFSLNNPMRYISIQFSETEFKSGDPLPLKQPLEAALKNLKKYYMVAPVIKEIAPGVSLYAPEPGTWFKGALLVFNPNRPPIWIPVSVKEIMEAKLAYLKIKQEIDSINYEKTLVAWAKLNFKPDQVMYPNQYTLVKNEFEKFTADELNRPAYSSAQSGISTINAAGEGKPVMKFNPACWDRTLPVTTIQFISMEYRPASESELKGFEQRNDGLADYVGLFYNSLPVEKLRVLVQTK